MATMRLYAGLIKQKSDSPDASRMADEMIHQVDRLSSMVQEILEFSRGTSTTVLTNMSLPAAMEQVLPFLETDLASRKITLVRAYGYDGVAFLDAGKFTRVLTNLVSNAADVMPEGGTVTIRTSRSDDRIVIDVSDTGPGIPEEIRQRFLNLSSLTERSTARVSAFPS